RTAVRRGRCRDRDLRRTLRMGRAEPEMLDHGMAGKPDLASDLEPFIARGYRGKGNTAVHHMLLDTVEAPEKIEMPPGAAELAVGDRLQADLFLLFDHPLDLAILDLLQPGRRDFAPGTLLTGFLQRRRTQQAADMVSAERRLGALAHGLVSPCIPTKCEQRPVNSPAQHSFHCSLLYIRRFNDPTLPRPLPQSSAVSPTARLQPRCCPLPSTQSRIAATGIAAPRARIRQPDRSAA